MANNVFLPPCPVVPMFLTIFSISNSFPAILTVTTPNNYIAGQLVKFNIPFDYGMQQINNLPAKVMSVDLTNLILTINIDTSLFDPFINPPSSNGKPATVSPAGSRNIYNNLTVPFHSEGNFGN